MNDEPVFLGNIGKQLYFFQILTHIDNIDNLTLCKMNIMNWKNYYKTRGNVVFELFGIYFIFSDEVFFLCISDTTLHYHLMDEREFFETLIDNRMEHTDQLKDLLFSLKHLTKYIHFHKNMTSTNGLTYNTVDDVLGKCV